MARSQAVREEELRIDGERWLPVVGYEEWYEVSDFGRVRRIKKSSNSHVGRILRPRVGTCGYLRIGLRSDGKQKQHMCHRLVADAFIGERPEHHDVHHVDGCKTNNRVNNLRYVTRKENVRLAFEDGLRKSNAGENHGNAKQTNESVLSIRSLSGVLSQRKIAKMFRTTQANVSRIILRDGWKHV